MKFNRSIHFILFFLFIVGFSCETEEPIPTFSLSTAVSPSEGGSILVSPPSIVYEQGQTVTLTPQPNSNWVFKQWEGNVSGTSNPLSLSMNTNTSVTGIFVKREFLLNINIEGEGTVTEIIVTNPSGRAYPHGTTVELIPVPVEGWLFESWGGDLSGSEIPKQITVDKERNITVKFILRKYPLNINIEGEGTVTEIIVTNPTGREYPRGTTVELTPVPVEGWLFESWGGDLSGSEIPKQITIDKEKNVTVKFIEEEFEDPDIVTDIDGNEYKTVRIGDQLWMAEDLRVKQFNDGIKIPTGLSSNEWLSTEKEAYAEIKEDLDITGAIFSKGIQYNGYAAGQRKRLCPVGWSVASYSDWQKLIDYLGGYIVAGAKLMSVNGYVRPGIPGPIVNPSYNSTGFSALPSTGFMNNGGGISLSFGGYSDWWSPVDSGPEVVDYFRRGVSFFNAHINTNPQAKTFGYCVRCIKN